MRLTNCERLQDVLDGRAGFSLRAEWGEISALLGGGHICSLVSQKHPDLNPLWRPPWRTIDPDSYRQDRDVARFGPQPDGRLLSGIAGHSLSFDYFGPPSEEETAAGLSTHGEAPAAQWQIHKLTNDAQVSVEYGVTLPVAQIEFSRTLRVDADHPVVYTEERARNLSWADRPISWNQHVTVGPPFLETGVTIVDMPATDARVIWASYSDAMAVTPDAEFQWPHAPLPDGGTHDLRTTPEGTYCRYTAQLLESTRRTGYVAIANPRQGLLLAYVFQREDFPWVGNWEERFYHRNAPWGGSTFCRGIEFSTTPFAQPRRKTVSEGPLFNQPTYRWLPAASEIAVRYLTILLEIPHDFKGVSAISLEGKQVIIQERGAARSFSVPVDDSFLGGGATGGQ